MKKILLSLVLLVLVGSSKAFAMMPVGHYRGEVTALMVEFCKIYSADIKIIKVGENNFFVKWVELGTKSSTPSAESIPCELEFSAFLESSHDANVWAATFFSNLGLKNGKAILSPTQLILTGHGESSDHDANHFEGKLIFGDDPKSITYKRFVRPVFYAEGNVQIK